MTDPVATLLEDAMSSVYPAALRTAVLLEIADQLENGPMSVRDLAQRTSAQPDGLYRVLRLLATRDVFTETRPGVFAMTHRAEPLRKSHPLANAVLLFTQTPHWRAVGELHHAVTSGTPSFERVYGEPFFDHAVTDPRYGAEFDRNMSAYTELDINSIAASCPLPRGGTVVDVAGGRGGLLLAALRKHPDLHGVLFDREHVLAGHVLDHPDIAGRWNTCVGDFFKEVPAADAYLLKNVLHDWKDDECVGILRNCVASANPGARVFVIDAVVPEGNEPHLSKTLDLFMQTLLAGRERKAAEFDDLFRSSGLRMKHVIPVPGAVSIVEASIEGEKKL
ncbi:methyltransferase [Saccharopolyspora sp. MS10]|uniref:methyltransferase n=1 Tax=Saccharopolyspora sp. MS10 TaxID=3385973 RepID=UPI0039A35905